jgi:hypothetical protein
VPPAPVLQPSDVDKTDATTTDVDKTDVDKTVTWGKKLGSLDDRVMG